MTALRWWALVWRFALRGGRPRVADEVPAWALSLPYRAWDRVCRYDGRTFADAHAAGLGPSARKVLPLRAMYLATVWCWPLVALWRALFRLGRAGRFYRGALARPEMVMLFPKAEFTDDELRWGRPDYALAIYYGWRYALRKEPWFALDDKMEFVRRCREKGLPLPPTFTRDEAVARGGTFIVKEPQRDLGFGVVALDADELREIEDPDGLVIQERLRNHPALRSLYPEDAPLSSFRVTTLRDPATGALRVWRCAVRMGRAGSVADNTQQGGVWCAVDPERGTLRAGVTKKTFGARKKGVAQRVTTHPDTGKDLVGARVPWFDEGRALALRAHEALAPAAPTLGWDIALAEDAPVLLEVNVWTTIYDYDPDDDAFAPGCAVIVDGVAALEAAG